MHCGCRGHHGITCEHAVDKRELKRLTDEIEALRTKLDVLQRRTSRHSLAKDLGSAVDADAAIMARITSERDAALGEIESLRSRNTMLIEQVDQSDSHLDLARLSLAKRSEEIEALRKQRNELANLLWMAEDQWSDDYLWKKWGLSAPLTDELKEELDMGIRK
jgi:chromosome segregation ATPase